MTPMLWLLFLALIGVLVAVDLAIVTRRPRAVSVGEAASSFALWVLAAVGFAFVLAKGYEADWRELQDVLGGVGDVGKLDGLSAALQFAACYVLELSLSLDNLAVLALLHAYYKLPRTVLARALFWTLLASLATRWGLILGAAHLLKAASWFHWVLGGVLVLAMIRMLVLPDESTEFDRRWYVRAVRRILPVSPDFDGHKLLTRQAAADAGKPRLMATPLLLVVIVSVLLDLVFAADSVPAMFSVTRDPFVAYTASALAILAMRALYLAATPAVARFRYLRISLTAILVFVSVKMLLARWQDEYREVPTLVTIAVTTGVMMLGIGASALRNRVLRRREPASVHTSTLQAIPPPIEDLAEAVDATRRNLRKVVILIAGTAVIVLGLAIAPLPGPGPTVLVPLGLALLATEFLWARALLNKLKSGAFNLSDRADALVDRTTVWVVPVVLIGWWLIAWGVGAWLKLSWWLVLVIFGSPFMPVAAWAGNYLRKRWRKR